MSNDILFLFFNGGGLDKKYWNEHPYKGKDFWLNRENENYKSSLLKKIKKIGKIYLHTPDFYIKNKLIKISDIDLIEYCKKIYDKIKKYNKIFIISHSRGNIIAKFFCQLYHKKIIGFINIDGGESNDWYKKKLKEWKDKYNYINDDELYKLFKKNDDKSYNIISDYIKYDIYKQSFKNKYNFENINMLILNNIYNDSELSINNQQYVNETLKSKFEFNKSFENMKNVKSIYYVGKTHFLYFYDDVVDDIIDYINKIIKK